jgi:hypothetical protein
MTPSTKSTSAGGGASRNTSETTSSKDSKDEQEQQEETQLIPAEKELLLCLRPIREGIKVDESLRFVPSTAAMQDAFGEALVSTSSGAESSNAQDQKGDSSSNGNDAMLPPANSPNAKRPPKKRVMESFSNDSPTKKVKTTPSSSGRASNASSTETEKSVVESLMLMNKSSQ